MRYLYVICLLAADSRYVIGTATRLRDLRKLLKSPEISPHYTEVECRRIPLSIYRAPAIRLGTPFSGFDWPTLRGYSEVFDPQRIERTKEGKEGDA